MIAVLDQGASTTALRSGAFVEIIVPDRSFENHFRVPESALYEGDTVYVIKDGEIASREVAVKAYDGDYVIVNGSLADGDQVMTTRIAEISNGLKVRAPDASTRRSPAGSDEGDQS